MPQQSRFRQNLRTDAPIWAKRIDEYLRDKKITQFELAKISGVSQATITGWLRDNVEPKVTGITNIANALDVSTDYLLGRTNIKSPEPDVQAACKLTGLSDKSISILKCWQIKAKEKQANVFKRNAIIIDTMISSGCLSKFMEAIRYYVTKKPENEKDGAFDEYYDFDYEVSKLDTPGLKLETIPPSKLLTLCRYECQEQAKKLIEDIVDVVIEREGSDNGKES